MPSGANNQANTRNRSAAGVAGYLSAGFIVTPMTEFGIGALGYERKERKERNQKRHISLEKKYKLKNMPKVVPLVPLVP